MARRFECILRGGYEDTVRQTVFFADEFDKGLEITKRRCPRGTVLDEKALAWDDQIIVDYNKFRECGCAVFEELGHNCYMGNLIK